MTTSTSTKTQSYWKEAEQTNGRLAMMGFVIAVLNYGFTGWIIPGIFWLNRSLTISIPQSKKMNENAEKQNGRWAMVGIIAALGSYALTGNIIPGIL